MSKKRVEPEHMTPPAGNYDLEVTCPDCEREFTISDSGECVHCGIEYQTVVEFVEDDSRTVVELGAVMFAFGAFFIGFVTGWANGSAMLITAILMGDGSIIRELFAGGIPLITGLNIPIQALPALALLGGVGLLAIFISDFTMKTRGGFDE